MIAYCETVGRASRFVIARADPGLHPAIDELGYRSENGVFVKTFPPRSRYAEIARENFPRLAGTMVHEAARTKVVNWQQALEGVLARLAGTGIEWYLVGSVALAVRGLDVGPRDVDLVVSARSAHLAVDRFSDALVEPVTEAEGWVARWFGRAYLGARVEWVADVTAHADGLDFGAPAAARLERVAWRGRELLVPPLELQLAVSEQRGLRERSALIRTLLVP